MPWFAGWSGARRIAIAAWVAAAVAPRALPAQRGGAVYGVVIDSLGSALRGVEVRIFENGRATSTDTAGRFALPGLPSGFYHMMLRHFPYRPISGTVRLADGDSIGLRFRMGLVALELDTVRVAAPAGPGLMAAFQRRRAAGIGTFITNDAIRQLETWPLQTIIATKAPRMQVVHFNSGGWGIANTRPSPCINKITCPAVPLCYPSIWMDGLVIYIPDSGAPPADLSQFDVRDLEAIEIYASPAETPLELGGTGASCGVIALWTHTPGRQR